MEIKDERIPHLIYLFKCGRIDARGQEELDLWIAASDDNRKIFEEVSNVSAIEKYAEKSSIDSAAAWAEFNKIIGRRAKNRNTRRLTWWSSAAAVAVVAVILVLTPRLFDSVPAISLDEIMPGDKKAVLTLADGTGVPLGSSHSGIIEQQNAQITIRDGEIAYTNTDSTASDIYNAVTVPRGGEYKLILPDGTVVWLNSDSYIKYPLPFSGDERRVSFHGEAYFDVVVDSVKPFVVETTGQLLTVLGTEFNISAYRGETNTLTTLINGSVRISATASGNITTLRPGQQSNVNNETGRLSIKEVDVREFVSWRDGRINIENNILAEVLTKLSRWYDVEFRIIDESINDIHFEGDIPKNSSLSSVINMLEKASNVKFRTNGQVIEVKRK